MSCSFLDRYTLFTFDTLGYQTPMFGGVSSSDKDATRQFGQGSFSLRLRSSLPRPVLTCDREAWVTTRWCNVGRIRSFPQRSIVKVGSNWFGDTSFVKKSTYLDNVAICTTPINGLVDSCHAVSSLAYVQYVHREPAICHDSLPLSLNKLVVDEPFKSMPYCLHMPDSSLLPPSLVCGLAASPQKCLLSRETSALRCPGKRIDQVPLMNYCVERFFSDSRVLWFRSGTNSHAFLEGEVVLCGAGQEWQL